MLQFSPSDLPGGHLQAVIDPDHTLLYNQNHYKLSARTQNLVVGTPYFRVNK